MDELKQIVKDRFKRVKEIMTSVTTHQHLRNLKEQQKLRCQKENWILSMIRINKNISRNIKQSYIKESLEIMKTIDENYNNPHLIQAQCKGEQNFLNQFINLYQHFFQKYEDKFSFKIKVKNFLRPNNQNIIFDLIKYLSDFSRDYYQQTFFWHAKSKKTSHYHPIQPYHISTLNQSCQQQPKTPKITLYTDTPQQKQLPNLITRKSTSTSLSLKSQIRRFDENVQIGNISNTINQIGKRQPQLIKHYQILEIANLPTIIYMDKHPNNIDVMKLRMNQLYREMKYRNSYSKATYNNYINSFKQMTFNHKSHSNHNADDHLHRISYPFKIYLHIQKNGFSSINIALQETRNYSVSIRKSQDISNNFLMKLTSNVQRQANQAHHQPYRSHQNYQSTTLKNDYMLNSLRVLRISQNFLPPLLNSSENAIEKNSKHCEPTNKSQAHKFYRLSQKLNSIIENQEKEGEKIRYYNMEAVSLEEKKEQQKKRLVNIRKHFTSQEKNKRNKLKADPQEKILEWLSKIKVMREVEKKKLLGIA